MRVYCWVGCVHVSDGFVGVGVLRALVSCGFLVWLAFRERIVRSISLGLFEFCALAGVGCCWSALTRRHVLDVPSIFALFLWSAE